MPTPRILRSQASIRSTSRLNEIKSTLTDITDDIDTLLGQSEADRSQADLDALKGKLKNLVRI